jgi:hypothetical protein
MDRPRCHFAVLGMVTSAPVRRLLSPVGSPLVDRNAQVSLGRPRSCTATSTARGPRLRAIPAHLSPRQFH